MRTVQSVLLGFTTGILVGERVAPKRGRRGKRGHTGPKGDLGQHGRPGPVGPMGPMGPAGRMPGVFGNDAHLTGGLGGISVGMFPKDDPDPQAIHFHGVMPEQQE